MIYDLCRYFTRQNYIKIESTINPNKLEIGHGKIHLDHKISIYIGCQNGIHPKIIAGEKNLQVIPYKENLNKGKKLLKEHFCLLEEMIEENNIKYPDFKKLLKDFISNKKTK